uniref:Uncharacterized protein n=1 Tax=Heterorhabditis bacteriophora TaxID=37862 RepID=A0A1I7WTT9_HETBA
MRKILNPLPEMFSFYHTIRSDIRTCKPQMVISTYKTLLFITNETLLKLF